MAYLVGMRQIGIAVVITALVLVFLTGCTSTTPEPVSTPVATSAPSTPVPTAQEETVQAPTTDSALEGPWYLKLMSDQNGTAPVQMISPEMMIQFEPDGQVFGNSGCNTYNANYSLTGETLPDGKGIAFGPLVSTKKYCADSGETETVYLEILQGSVSYLVNVNEELTLTDTLGNALVYQRTPYDATAVPQGS